MVCTTEIDLMNATENLVGCKFLSDISVRSD